MQDLLYDLVLHGDAPEHGAGQSSGRGRSVRGLRPATVLAFIVLAAAVALIWNRWPPSLPETVGDRLAATGNGLTQAVEAAGLWVTDRLAAPGSDADSAASSGAAPAPGAGPAIEPPPPAAASPSPAAAIPLSPADLPAEEPADLAAAPAASAPTDPAAPSANQTAAAVDHPAPPTPPASEPASAEPVASAEARPDAPAPVAAPQTGGGPGRLEFSADSVSVGESGSVARVKVRRRGGAAGEVSFSWTTVDDSAIAGEDYAPATVREVLADGQTGATLLIPIVSDSIAEQTELFDVVIEDADGAELGSLTRVPVIIVDDD